MKNTLNLILRLFGLALIIVGIVMAIIPMFNFNVFTFKLSLSIIFALGFPFVGIVLIIVSYALSAMDEEETPPHDTRKNKGKKK